MRVFLSFNSKDASVAAALRAALLKLDPSADIFFAPISFLGQGFWLPKLAREIGAADAFLLLLGPRGVGPWQEVEYHEAFGKHVQDASFALVPVIVGDGQVPGLPFLRRLNWVEIPEAFDNNALHRVLTALKDGAGPTVSPLWKLVHPYRGLEAMTEANADYFYGRRPETETVLSLLAGKPGRLPILIGASGVGKSSVAQAGVLSALKAMRWPGQGDGAAKAPPWPEAFRNSRTGWAWLVVRPGDDPLHGLASAFTRLWLKDPTDSNRGPLARQWAEGLRTVNTLSDLIQATQDQLEQSDGVRPDRILLYLDQGEELYTGAARTAPKDARRFSEVLAEGLRDRCLVAFASFRADYFDRLQADTPLFSVHELVNVPPLTRTALGEVVVEPAKALGVGFEDDRLPDRIVEAAAGEPGALPLLSYLLTDMWSVMVKRADGVLRLPAQAIDVGGVLAATAEKFLKATPAVERSLKRLLTLKLALVPAEGEPLRRQARRFECSAEEWSLAEQLAEYPWRLVVTGEREADDDAGGSEVTAEVAHEALLRAWPRLAAWLRDEREFLVFKGEAERAERRWRRMQRPDRALLSGLDLDRAIEWLPKRPEDLSSQVRAFIQASITFDRTSKEKQLRFRGQVSIGAVLAALIIAGLGGVAWWKWQEAKRQQARAEAALTEAQASLWLANSRSELRDGRVASAIGYAVKAFKKLPIEASRSALASAVFELSPHLQRTFDVGPGVNEAIAWTRPDAVVFATSQGGGQFRTLATTSSPPGGTATDWPMPQLTRVQDGNRAAIRALRALDPDRMLAVLDNGALALIERGATSPYVRIPPQPVTLCANAHAAAISRSGALVAIANTDADVVLIKCTTLAGRETSPDCRNTSLPTVRGKAVAISPDETRVAVADESGTVSIYDPSGTRLGQPILVGGSIVALGWAKTTDWLAVGDVDGNVVVIDLGAPNQPLIAKASFGGAPITTLTWSPEGLKLAFSCGSRNVCLWLGATDPTGRASFAPIRRFEGHSGTVTRLAWSSDGDHIASGSTDGTVRVWSLDQNTEAGLTLYAESSAKVTKVATSLDGRWVAGGGNDGTIRIWDAVSGSLLKTVKSSYSSEVAALAWNHSGLLAAALDSRGIILVPADTQEPLREIAIDTDLDTRITFVEDDKTIAMPQHSDKRIALIDVAGSGEPTLHYLDPISRNQAPWGLAVDSSGKRLFASYTGANGEIRIWDLAKRALLLPMAYTLKEKQDPVAGGSLSVSRDGRWLATSGGDNYVRVYDIMQNKSWRALPMDLNSGAPNPVAFSPDGTKLAALGADNRVYVWSLRGDVADRYVVFQAVPNRSPVAEAERRTQFGTWLAWVTNDSIALATGTSSMNVIGLNPAKWRRRIDDIAPVATSSIR